MLIKILIFIFSNFEVILIERIRECFVFMVVLYLWGFVVGVRCCVVR